MGSRWVIFFGCGRNEPVSEKIPRTASVVDSVDVPAAAPVFPVQPVDAAAVELEVPVVALHGILRPPAFFEAPGARGYLDASAQDRCLVRALVDDGLHLQGAFVGGVATSVPRSGAPLRK